MKTLANEHNPLDWIVDAQFYILFVRTGIADLTYITYLSYSLTSFISNFSLLEVKTLANGRNPLDWIVDAKFNI